MKIDRNLFLSRIHIRYSPKWPCPSCERGTLTVKKDSLQYQESKTSALLEGHPDWEPHWVEEIFICILICTEPTCQEVIAVTGKTENHVHTHVDEESGEPEEIKSRSFIPMSFYPPINLFPISRSVPKEIADAILDAFKLFWVDDKSCANKIRVSVELILDHYKIKTWTLSKTRKRVAIALHHRIEYFERKEPMIAKSLFAIKWIGNAGSHAGNITKSDLFDGFDILKYIIEEMFDQRTKAITELGKRINKKKGPLSRIRAMF